MFFLPILGSYAERNAVLRAEGLLSGVIKAEVAVIFIAIVYFKHYFMLGLTILGHILE